MSGNFYDVGVMVAHPDDEVLWAGGLLLGHAAWRVRIGTLCRAEDADRTPKFHAVCERLGASGAMAAMDDGPEQVPLTETAVQEAVLAVLGDDGYDLLLTHGPWGEYTRHRRHEEVSRAVMALWQHGRLRARQLWLFAFEDGDRAYLPRPRADAHRRIALEPRIWQEKYGVIHELYGFAAESWEARAVPREEAFWCFETPEALATWRAEMGDTNESPGDV